jgi:AcrR family transcriptional regulator
VALELADVVGFEALTMRAVAQRGGVATMSLYTHFKSKQDLLDAMFAEIAQELWRDSGKPTWQAEMQAFCERAHGLLLAHPHWTQLFMRTGSSVPAAVRERLLCMMTRDGFSLDEAHEAIIHAILLVLGFASNELAFRNPSGTCVLNDKYELFARSAEQPEFAAAYPLTHLAARGLPRLELAQCFYHAVQISIRGLEAKRTHAEEQEAFHEPAPE